MRKMFPAADPFVMRSGDLYYMYTAGRTFGTFDVRVSCDLIRWSEPKLIYSAEGDTWSKDCYWAPECHCINGMYYLFFSANRADSTEEESFAITCVRSKTPDGIFEDYLKRPLFITPYPAIDGNILCEDGHIYLYFSRCCYKHSVNGIEESWIYATEISQDMTRILFEPRLLLKPEQEWEGRSVPTTGRRWNEGSFIKKVDGLYYMIYSANCYLEKHYAMGYAVGRAPLGPFVKAEDNPITRCTDEITGTGHGCLVDTPEGIVAVYHGRTAESEKEFTGGETRVPFAARVVIGNENMKIDFEHARIMTEEN